MSGELIRTPPQNVTAEMFVLGSVMLSAEAVERCLPMLKPEDFYVPKHETIWRAVRRMVEAGASVDALTVSEALQKSGDLAQIGGFIYLHDLVKDLPTPANADHYAGIVAGRAALRRLIVAGNQIVNLGFSAADDSGGGEVAEVVNAAQAKVLDLDNPGRRKGRMIGPIVEEFMESVESGDREALATVDWPYGDDMPPMAAGRLTVIAGRPAMGKSVCAMDAARHVAVKLRRPVAFFSLEMSEAEVGARTTAAEAGIELPHLKPGQMTPTDWDMWANRCGAVLDAPLLVDDYPHADPAYIRSESRRLKREHGDLGLVVVDFLQLMEASKRTESREQEISGYSRALKVLAKDLDCPVIAVCQLNRGPEQRNDKKPQMSDLRESGAIEQNADQVILVFREDYYEPESPEAGVVQLIIAKNRFGPQKTVFLTHQLSMARFKPSTWSPGDALRKAS